MQANDEPARPRRLICLSLHPQLEPVGARCRHRQTQLTFDSQPDCGYATDNAGWKHTDKRHLVWSPDGRKIATFQQDQRKTSTMTLVGTNVGAPKGRTVEVPFAGDRT